MSKSILSVLLVDAKMPETCAKVSLSRFKWRPAWWWKKDDSFALGSLLSILVTDGRNKARLPSCVALTQSTLRIVQANHSYIAQLMVHSGHIKCRNFKMWTLSWLLHYLDAKCIDNVELPPHIHTADTHSTSDLFDTHQNTYNYELANEVILKAPATSLILLKHLFLIYLFPLQPLRCWSPSQLPWSEGGVTL